MRYGLLLLIFIQALVFAEPIQITDSRGRITFAESPKRVVVVNWTMTEQLLELGIKPVGIADIEGYYQQGGKPLIDSAVVDVGKRTAPDFKKIAALQPDVIVVGYSQRPFLRALGKIATVVYFKSFSRRYNNEEKSRQRFMELAKLFGRQDAAVERLALRDKRIAELKRQLQTRFKSHMPTLTMLVPERKHLWVFAENSMPYYAAQQLGLALSTSYPVSQYGVHKQVLADLPDVAGLSDERVCVLLLDAGSEGFKAPVVAEIRQKYSCVRQLPALHVYGGSASIEYLAEAIVAALLE